MTSFPDLALPFPYENLTTTLTESIFTCSIFPDQPRHNETQKSGGGLPD
jgi:hypothetical protein